MRPFEIITDYTFNTTVSPRSNIHFLDEMDFDLDIRDIRAGVEIVMKYISNERALIASGLIEFCDSYTW